MARNHYTPDGRRSWRPASTRSVPSASPDSQGHFSISRRVLRRALRGVGVRHIQLRNVGQDEREGEFPLVVSSDRSRESYSDPSNHGSPEWDIENEAALPASPVPLTPSGPCHKVSLRHRPAFMQALSMDKVRDLLCFPAGVQPMPRVLHVVGPWAAPGVLTRSLFQWR